MAYLFEPAQALPPLAVREWIGSDAERIINLYFFGVPAA